jgi:hypothetical protein
VLPDEDIAFLQAKGYKYTYTSDKGVGHLVIADFPFPAAYTPRIAELLIRVLSGYPNGQLDMFWTIPDVKLASNNIFPQACAHKESYLNRTWQRWSRHWQTEWRPGVDNLETFIGAIIHELNKGR